MFEESLQSLDFDLWLFGNLFDGLLLYFVSTILG